MAASDGGGYNKGNLPEILHWELLDTCKSASAGLSGPGLFTGSAQIVSSLLTDKIRY
jgi:hypothetical protein